jgi:hypothetical protein
MLNTRLYINLLEIMEFKYNLFLESVTQTGKFRNMVKIANKALNAQWQDVLMSGILNDLEKLVQTRFLRKETADKIQKATRDEALSPDGKDGLINNKALKIAVTGLVAKKFSNLGNLFNFKKEFDGFLQFVAQKGGQQVLDQISDYTNTSPKIFRLSLEYARKKITNRINTLVKTLDKTGKELFTKEMIKGIEQGLTKKQMVNNILKRGTKISEYRAWRIVENETNAVYEFMRFETAKLNGIEMKLWISAGDDRVCFPEFTQVLTSKGEKPIQNIKVGDLVETRKGLKKVMATSKKKYCGGMTRLLTYNTTLFATDDHPVWESAKGWLKINEFKVWNSVQYVKKKQSKVVEIAHKMLDKSIYVYDIQVEEQPEFYANGILVHNCPICRPNDDGVPRPLRESFPSGHSRPPAHILGRCMLLYIMDNDVLGLTGLNDIMKKSMNVDDRLDYILKAKIDPNDYYEVSENHKVQKIVNPNALWIGGENLVGKDKQVGLLAQKLQWNTTARSFINKVDEIALVFKNKYLGKYGTALFNAPKTVEELTGQKLGKTELLMVEARVMLTDIGFLQLLRSKGYKGKIDAIWGYPEYPDKPLNEVARRHAQDVVKDMEDIKGNIDLKKYNIGFTEITPKKDDLKIIKNNKEIKLRKIEITTPILKGKRVISIMDNFNESQRRGGGGVEVIKGESKLVDEERYYVYRDGNHRVFAAEKLGLHKIFVSKIWEQNKNT